jgi:predicted transcriptional regulator
MTQTSGSSPEHAPPGRRAKPTGLPARSAGRLGEREREVLEILWASGSATVHQVSCGLPVRLAYTTVMTTLDRLFKKGLLRREKQDRAFLYMPAYSPNDVESGRAHALVHRFFSDAPSSKDMLLSCLVDAIGSYDNDMLDQLEGKVREARQRLNAEQSTPVDLSGRRS